METFREKTVDDLGEWLRTNNFSEKVIQTFQEEEIDGEAFLLMSVDDIVSLVSSKGAQLKLAEKKRQLSSSQPTAANDLNIVPKQAKDLQNQLKPRDEYCSDDDMLCDIPYTSATIAKQVQEMAGRKRRFVVDDSDSDTENELTPKRARVDSSESPIHSKIQEYIESENNDPNLQHLDKPGLVKMADPTKCIRQLNRVTQRKQEPPLPKPFPLPKNFPPAVALALEGKTLTGKTRAKFVTALANSVFMHKSYPTSRELEDVVRAAIKQWEFLGTTSGCDWLVEALRERMKYFRRNRVPVQHEPSTKKMAVAKMPTYQMPHVPSLPPIADGEDEASHDRHVKVLSLEFKKGKPNKHAVAELMKRTFSVRRQRILTAPLSMESLLKTYPPLKQYNQLTAELDRTMGRQISQELREGWENLVPKVIATAEEETDNANIQAMISLAPADMSDDGKSIHAIILLYHLMPDTKTATNHHRIICIVPDTTTPKDAATEMCTAQPCVVVRGSLEDLKDAFLVVEKQIVCQIPLREVPLALLSAFFSFNMHYPQGCTNFYTFFECFFMGKKTPTKKTRLASMLARIENC